MDAIAQDVRYAIRHLRQSPGFALAAIVTLALGVGANTAMFSVLNALVLRPLPIPSPEHLIGIGSFTALGQRRLTLISAVAELERDGPLQDVCGINGGGIFAADVNGSPTQSVIAIVTGKCFKVFGVAPLIGRVITDEEAPLTQRGQMVTVIGHRFWTRMFGANPNAIGRTIRMEGVELTVIGVMPAGFGGLQADVGVDLYVPNYTVTPMRPERPSGASHLIGRLKPGVSIEGAAAQLEARWPSLLQATVPATLAEPERSDYTSSRVRLERLTTGISFYRERYARPLTIIVGLTAILLVLACINLGGLLLSRLSARGAELGIRLALGGSGARIAQQLLIESLLLSLAGAVLAVPASFAFVGMLSSFVPSPLVERTVTFEPDLNVIAATAVCGFAAGALMSALPIWLAWRRRGAVTFTWDRTIAGSTNRWARTLLVAQIALSVVMLTGAGLLIRSLHLLMTTDRGVRTERVLNIKVMPLPNAYRTIDNSSYFPALYDEIRAIPGVRSVGFARGFPRVVSEIVGQPIAFVGEAAGAVRAQLESASPGFFETAGIALLRGRLPQWSDRAATPQVAVVSDSLARKLDPNGDVIGRHVKFGVGRADQNVEVVGIVANASLGNPRQNDGPVFYRPTLQSGLFANYPNLIVATDGDPLAIAPRVEQVLKAAGREYAHQITTVDRVFAQSPSSERMSAALASAIAVLAVMLAFIGVYGLLAYAVSRRTREIGVRVALGAERRTVIGLVMRDGLRLTALGIAIGLPAAIASSRVLKTLMFGITEMDPIVLGATAVFFLVLGIAAGVVPALRAASVDPVIALRTD